MSLLFIVVLLPSLLISTIIQDIIPRCEAFGHGSAIMATFYSSYCPSGISPMHRGPLHYDLLSCGGMCMAQIAPKTHYAISVKPNHYFGKENVTVTLQANRLLGAALLGFAILAISESGRTAGTWLVEDSGMNPEMLRASCDGVLEGQVIFHAMSSPTRYIVQAVWNAVNVNYGTVRFRAWIVQRHDVIFTLDSQPIINPINGSLAVSIEDQLSSIILDIVADSSKRLISDARYRRIQTPKAHRTGTQINSTTSNKIKQISGFHSLISNNNLLPRIPFKGRTKSVQISQISNRRNIPVIILPNHRLSRTRLSTTFTTNNTSMSINPQPVIPESGTLSPSLPSVNQLDSSFIIPNRNFDAPSLRHVMTTLEMRMRSNKGNGKQPTSTKQKLFQRFEDAFDYRLRKGFSLNSRNPFRRFNTDFYALSDFFPQKRQ